MSEQKQNNLKHMIWCRREYECNISTHCTDILWFTFIMRLMGSRRSGCREQGLWFALAACLPLDRNMPAAVTVNTFVPQPTSANSDFWRTFLVQLHVTIKHLQLLPSWMVFSSEEAGRSFSGWEENQQLLFFCWLESLLRFCSSLVFCISTLTVNFSVTQKRKRYHVQRQGLPNVHFICAVTEGPRNAQTCFWPKLAHFGHN